MRDEDIAHFRMMFLGLCIGLLAINAMPYLVLRIVLNEIICLTLLCLYYGCRQSIRLRVLAEFCEYIFVLCGCQPPARQPAKRSPFDGSPAPRTFLILLLMQGMTCVLGEDEIFRRMAYTVGFSILALDECKDFCKAVAKEMSAEITPGFQLAPGRGVIDL